MNNISVIIPLHKYDDDVKSLLNRAIESVPSDYDIIVSTTSECAAAIEKDKKFNTDRIAVEWHTDTETNEEVSSDFSTLVNYSVNNITTPYFSILEYDDVYTDIWFRNVEEYVKFNPEVSVFLPLNDLIDFNDNRFLGYGNEAPWASSFSNEIGYVDNDCLQQFFDFYLTGAVFNKEDWTNNGGLKSSIKVTFWYEFLLRLTNNGKKVFVIPKVGYKHYVNRKDSLYDVYRQTVDEKESNWWFELAKKECFYKQDRNKTYNNNNEEGK